MDLETFLVSGWPMMRPTYKMDQRMFVPPTTEAPAEALTPPPVPGSEGKVGDSCEGIRVMDLKIVAVGGKKIILWSERKRHTHIYIPIYSYILVHLYID